MRIAMESSCIAYIVLIRTYRAMDLKFTITPTAIIARTVPPTIFHFIREPPESVIPQFELLHRPPFLLLRLTRCPLLRAAWAHNRECGRFAGPRPSAVQRRER